MAIHQDGQAVRQVLREPAEDGLDASMEPEHAGMEEAAFRQVAASRQAGPEHNTTVGGSQVAWLNAARGRMVGPGRVQEVFRGDRVRLSVYGKYEDRGDKANEGLFAPSGVAEALVSDAGDLSITGAANQHEILEENLYIAEDGYMEAFVIN